MAFQIARARALYAQSDQGIEELPRYARPAVQLARVLYSKILDRIEEENYNVFGQRLRVSRWQKLQCLARLLLTGNGMRRDSNEALASVA